MSQIKMITDDAYTDWFEVSVEIEVRWMSAKSTWKKLSQMNKEKIQGLFNDRNLHLVVEKGKLSQNYLCNL